MTFGSAGSVSANDTVAINANKVATSKRIWIASRDEQVKQV